MKKQKTKTELALAKAFDEVLGRPTNLSGINQVFALSKKVMHVAKGDMWLAMQTLTAVLKKDKGYRLSFHANIAMAFKDSYAQHRKQHGKKTMSNTDVHIIANVAAEYFLQLLCDEIKYPEGR